MARFSRDMDKMVLLAIVLVILAIVVPNVIKWQERRAARAVAADAGN